MPCHPRKGPSDLHGRRNQIQDLVGSDEYSDGTRENRWLNIANQYKDAHYLARSFTGFEFLSYTHQASIPKLPRDCPFKCPHRP